MDEGSTEEGPCNRLSNGYPARNSVRYRVWAALVDSRSRKVGHRGRVMAA